MSLRPVVLLLALATSSSLNAATEFENGLAPVDLVRQFTGGAVYRSLPDGFPVVSLPAGTDVRLIGSMQRGSSLDVLLGTTQNVSTLRAALVAAYTAAGWVDVSTMNSGINYMCHDQAGYLVIAPASLGYNGLRLTSMPTYRSPDLTCSEQAAGGASGWDIYFIELVPTLVAPPQTLTPVILQFPSTSMSSSYNSSGSSVDLTREGLIEVPDINVAGLYSHFAARLVEQGWQNDSEGYGTTSATSVWYKSVAPPDFVTDDIGDTEVTAVMTVLHEGEDRYRVSLRVKAKTDAVITSGAWLSVRDFVPLGPILNDPVIGIRGIPSGFIVR